MAGGMHALAQERLTSAWVVQVLYFWLTHTCALQAHEVEKAAAHHSAGAALQKTGHSPCPASG